MTNELLQATDVVKSYNKKKEVLHSVSLTIEPGKICWPHRTQRRGQTHCSAF